MRPCRFFSFCVKEHLRTRVGISLLAIQKTCSSSLFGWIPSCSWSNNSDYSGLDGSDRVCVEVTVAIISSSDQKSWMRMTVFSSVNSSLSLCPGISFESGEAVSGKYLISLSGTQPLPANARAMLCWYLTTFFNYTSCRTQALTDLVALSAPFGCISIHGWDLHLQVWWIPICCSLLSYLYFHPSDQKDLSKPL